MSPGIFITGTNTGVGKTLVTAAWAHGLAESGLKVVGLKPVASGAMRGPDAHLVRRKSLLAPPTSRARRP